MLLSCCNWNRLTELQLAKLQPMYSQQRHQYSNNERRSPQHDTPRPQRLPPGFDLFWYPDVEKYLTEEQALPMPFVGLDGAHDRLIAEARSLEYPRDVLAEIGYHQTEHLCWCVAFTLKMFYPNSTALCFLARDDAEFHFAQECEETLQQMNLGVLFTTELRPKAAK